MQMLVNDHRQLYFKIDLDSTGGIMSSQGTVSYQGSVCPSIVMS